MLWMVHFVHTKVASGSSCYNVLFPCYLFHFIFPFNFSSFWVRYFHVAKCNLGKVRLEPMQSAIRFVAVCDLWGGP